MMAMKDLVHPKGILNGGLSVPRMKGGQSLLVVRVACGVRKTTGGGSWLETATKDLLIDAKAVGVCY